MVNLEENNTLFKQYRTTTGIDSKSDIKSQILLEEVEEDEQDKKLSITVDAQHINE